MKDKINPNYYKDNPIQTFDAITSQFTDAEKIGAIKFNICKYIMRMGKKVETLEGARDDAGKAHWYCERLLKELTDMIKKKTPKKKPQDKDPHIDQRQGGARCCISATLGLFYFCWRTALSRLHL